MNQAVNSNSKPNHTDDDDDDENKDVLYPIRSIVGIECFDFSLEFIQFSH